MGLGMIKEAVFNVGVYRFLKKAGLLGKVQAAYKKDPTGVIHHGLELGGLGTLAAPSVAHLYGHDMDENMKSGLEIGGLGLISAVEGHGLYNKYKAAVPKIRGAV